MADILLARALRAAPLVPSPPRFFRNRMVYDLSIPPGLDDTLAMPRVSAAHRAVWSWVSCSTRMPRDFWRELTVRVSRAGAVQLKLLLQLPPSAHTRAVVSSPHSGDELAESPPHALLGEDEDTAQEAAGALESEVDWASEKLAFLAFVSNELDGAVQSICYQLAFGRARPKKHAPCFHLHGPLQLIEQCSLNGAGSRDSWYYVSPETLSQVNPVTGDALYSHVAGWLGERDSGESEIGVDQAGAQMVRSAMEAARHSGGGVLVTGRDVNLFGIALFRKSSLRLNILTHCPNAYQDVLLNSASCARAERIQAWLIEKGGATASFLQEMTRHSTFPSPPPRRPNRNEPHAAPPPAVAIVTAGRRGVGSLVCAALCDLPLQALVYVSCCHSTLYSDAAHLLGERGFVVVSAARYDHFPGSRFTGSALLLVRRPPFLVLPVGPAASGKSTLCRLLQRSLPSGAALVAERDQLLASAREDGLSLARARKRTQSQVC